MTRRRLDSYKGCQKEMSNLSRECMNAIKLNLFCACLAFYRIFDECLPWNLILDCPQTMPSNYKLWFAINVYSDQFHSVHFSASLWCCWPSFPPSCVSLPGSFLAPSLLLRSLDETFNMLRDLYTATKHPHLEICFVNTAHGRGRIRRESLLLKVKKGRGKGRFVINLRPNLKFYPKVPNSDWWQGTWLHPRPGLQTFVWQLNFLIQERCVSKLGLQI